VNRFLELLGKLPTTQLRIVVSLALASTVVLVALVADMINRPIGQGTLNTLTLFILGAMAADVGQFASKRFSDSGYAAAKNTAPSPTVNAEAGSKVTLEAGPAKPTPPLAPEETT